MSLLNWTTFNRFAPGAILSPKHNSSHIRKRECSEIKHGWCQPPMTTLTTKTTMEQVHQDMSVQHRHVERPEPTYCVAFSTFICSFNSSSSKGKLHWSVMIRCLVGVLELRSLESCLSIYNFHLPPTVFLRTTEKPVSMMLKCCCGGRRLTTTKAGPAGHERHTRSQRAARVSLRFADRLYSGSAWWLTTDL